MLTSIVMLTLNNMEQTLRCIRSIRKYTDAPYELIVVDNGSVDGTIGRLRKQPSIRLLRNGSNLGFAAASNQGMAMARGDVIVLLNNDTLVSPRWLTQLRAALLRDESVGVVGPVSNLVLPMQKLPDSLAANSFFAFAGRYNRHNPARWRDATALSGFCMVLRRSTFKLLGGLDEQFAIGGYEDIDFGYRALREGLRLRIAGDTVVYHEGGRSFQANRYDMTAISGVNRRRFIRKWGFNPERLILTLDPGFMSGTYVPAHPHHPPPISDSPLPSGWYGFDTDSRVYRVERGKRRPIVSSLDFLLLRLPFERVAADAGNLLRELPDGSPIRPAGGLLTEYPDVFFASDPFQILYLVAHGIRYRLIDPNAISTLGIRWEETIQLNMQQLLSLQEGWSIQGNLWEAHELIDHLLYSLPGGGLYYGEGQRLRPIANESVLARFGWQSDRAVPMPDSVFRRLPQGPAIV